MANYSLQKYWNREFFRLWWFYIFTRIIASLMANCLESFKGYVRTQTVKSKRSTVIYKLCFKLLKNIFCRSFIIGIFKLLFIERFYLALTYASRLRSGIERGGPVSGMESRMDCPGKGPPPPEPPGAMTSPPANMRSMRRLSCSRSSENLRLNSN